MLASRGSHAQLDQQVDEDEPLFHGEENVARSEGKYSVTLGRNREALLRSVVVSADVFGYTTGIATSRELSIAASASSCEAMRGDSRK